MRKLWGGAFESAPDDLAWRFGQSIESDTTLWREEIDVSIAHARMLGATSIISTEDSERIVSALESIGVELGSGSFQLPLDAEDIHVAIESALRERVGNVAGKLHTGRSRNDQIATVSRLWLRRRITDLLAEARALQSVILNLAETHEQTAMPGYTHMQRAQPITLGFHLLAHFWMIQRDVARLKALDAACDACPLGSAALAGTSFPIDRRMTARELGFAAASENSLDATSDRDFVGDALHACATIMQHLSRLSQEIVLWCTSEYSFMRLSDAYATGSSIMPQKRNPDFAELIRGRTGRAIGNWVTFHSMMKGLPLGYNRDQQDDKPPLFDSVRLCFDSLALTRGMLSTAEFNVERMKSSANEGNILATVVADVLAASGMPFREAHEFTGTIVRASERRGWTLAELDEARLSELGFSQHTEQILGAVRANRPNVAVDLESARRQLAQT